MICKRDILQEATAKKIICELGFVILQGPISKLLLIIQLFASSYNLRFNITSFYLNVQLVPGDEVIPVGKKFWFNGFCGGVHTRRDLGLFICRSSFVF